MLQTSSSTPVRVSFSGRDKEAAHHPGVGRRRRLEDWRRPEVDTGWIDLLAAHEARHVFWRGMPHASVADREPRAVGEFDGISRVQSRHATGVRLKVGSARQDDAGSKRARDRSARDRDHPADLLPDIADVDRRRHRDGEMRDEAEVWCHVVWSAAMNPAAGASRVGRLWIRSRRLTQRDSASIAIDRPAVAASTITARSKARS